MIGRSGMIGHVFLDAAAAHFLDLLNSVQVDAVFVDDVAVGIAHRDYLAAQLGSLLVGVDGHVARAGHDHGLALEALALAGEHFAGEVRQTKAAVGQALAGQHALIQAGDALVLAVQIPDFARAHADVARRNVHVRADVAVQFGHEALAEGHDFAVALALGVEVAAALAAADGQAGQGVFEALLKAQELDYALIHRRMQAQAALVRADGVVELHAEAAVHMVLALVVHPRYLEGNKAVRLDDAFEYGVLLVFGVLFDYGLEAV